MKCTHPLVAAAGALALLAACSSTPRPTEVDSYLQAKDGTLLYYKKTGPEVGEAPVLLVPGASWLDQDLASLAKGRTVIFYDTRGRGRSDVTSIARFERDLEDIEAVRDWFGLESFSMLGFDYQAALAAFYAAQNPERVEKLVLVAPIPARHTPYFEIYRRIFDDRRNEKAFRELSQMRRDRVPHTDPKAWAAAYAKALFQPWFHDPRTMSRMKNTPYVEPNIDPERQVLQYLSLLRAMGEWDWRSELGKITTPTLLVWGESDPVPLEARLEWGRSVPGSQTESLPRAGHLPWIEQPSRFMRTVETFLNG